METDNQRVKGMTTGLTEEKVKLICNLVSTGTPIEDVCKQVGIYQSFLSNFLKQGRKLRDKKKRGNTAFSDNEKLLISFVDQFDVAVTQKQDHQKKKSSKKTLVEPPEKVEIDG